MMAPPVSSKTMNHPALGSNPLLRGLLRLLLPVVAIVLALTAEVSMVPRLHLPAAGPDLLLLVAVGFAVVWGPAGGAVTGFAAGLALDIAPPSVDAIGRHALVLTCVGALAGRAGRKVSDSALRTCLLAGIYAGAAVLGNAALGTLLGDGAGLDRAGLVAAAGAAAFYTAVATPLIVPGISALARRTQSPGARVLAPAGDALGSASGFGVRGAYEGITFRGVVVSAPATAMASVSGSPAPGSPYPAANSKPHAPAHPASHVHQRPPAHPTTHPAHRDPAAPDLPARPARRAVQNPEAG
jgi:rod shape-determining protein MreD